MLGIAPIDLIPPRNLAGAFLSDERLDADVQSLQQRARSDHQLHHVEILPAWLDMKLLDPPDWPVVAGQDRPAQDFIEIEFVVVHRLAPGMVLTSRCSFRSRFAAGVSPNARSTFTSSPTSRI